MAMTDDPNLDGASLIAVGEHVLAAARERPALGLALGREFERASAPGMWFIGTRVARAPESPTSDVRFDGGAPPVSALAERIEVGEFGQWFGELKADADAGRVYPVRGATGRRIAPRAQARPANSLPACTAIAPAPVHRLVFPAAEGTAIRARHGRG